ncbi:MAG: glycosyltransferase family 4 protein [Spirulina sp. SIO3F2]|nr:glycosyltransferase family 4 protein [Spirulina sp. SIO3F2]
MAKISLLVSDLSGGGAIRAFLLAQVLQRLHHQPEVVGFQFGPQLYAVPPDGIPVHVIPGRPYPQFLSAIRQLWPHLDGQILYAIKPKPSSFGVALLRRFRTHQPVFLDMDDWELSWHGGDAWRYRPNPKQLYRDLCKPGGQLREPDHPLYVKWLEGAVRYAGGLTVDTAFLQQRFGGDYLPNGKDTQLFDPARYEPDQCRQKYGLTPYRVLMFPGAPRPHKGVEDVLTALEHLNDERYRLVIVGGSPYDDYDARLRDRWGRWLIQLPRCPVATMPEILAAAHVVMVPQRQTLTAEAQFPLKLTDGMAMAKPVLSTTVGDIPAILDNTGYLVPPNDPEAIATTLSQIFQDWERAQQRGAAARKRCIQYYSVEEMAITLQRMIQPFLT